MILLLVQVVNATTSGSNSTSSGSRSSVESTSAGSMKKRKRVTMLDVIKERKLQFLSEVNPRDPGKFVSRARGLGIVVLEGSRDVALVDPGFYSGFLDKLRGLRTSNEDLIRRSLGEEEFKLFMFLRENGLIYFDGVEQSWRLVE